MTNLVDILKLNRSGKTTTQFARAINWIHGHQSLEGGIQVSSANSNMYPEVTGYFIPSLINWGEIELAKQFGDALIEVQQDDGSFLDSGSTTKCVFDTGQIVRGLFALYEYTNETKYFQALNKAIEWINSTIGNDGRVNAPDVDVWGGVIPIGILLYALEPALRISKILGLNDLKLESAIALLLSDENLEKFTSVSHFHAYIIEALVDLGEVERAEKSLLPLLEAQNFRNWIPGKPDRKWVCSTAMFQYAVVCFKIGLYKEGEKLFLAAARLQNRSGGWFGSYGWTAKILAPLGRLHPHFGMYFPRTEIPWVVKYFLDSLQLRLEKNFDLVSNTFSNHIDSNDGRLTLVLETIENIKPDKILDLGCGKGRYIKHIVEHFPEIEIHACDISNNVTASLLNLVVVTNGSIVKTPYADNEFEFIFTIEALEHSVNLDAALRELDRILAPNGSVMIIDKNISKLGRLKLPDWEQWFDVDDLAHKLRKRSYAVTIHKKVDYENRKDGLFFALIGQKNG